MEENIQGMTDGKINLMVLVVSMPVGGVETQILSVLQRLKKEKYNITICCIRDLGIFGEKVADTGMKIIALNLMKSSRFTLSIPSRISKIIKENNIHILWTHQYVANFYGRMASLFMSVPAVIPTFHVTYDNPKIHRRILNHLLSYKTDVMVSVSNAVADDIAGFDRVPREKIKTIYNGIDEKMFNVKLSKQEARKIFGLPSDIMIIGTVGRLAEQKGHRDLIRAVSKVKDVCTVVAGDGPLMEELKNMAGRLQARCIFTGRLGHEEIPLFLKSLDVFCFPSLWEGFGIAVAEAMAAGLPVVASDIAPHKEVLNDAGLLVPAGNAGALEDKLKTLINDNALRESFGRKAKERAKMFSIENTVKAYDGLFEGALRKHKVVLT